MSSIGMYWNCDDWIINIFAGMWSLGPGTLLGIPLAVYAFILMIYASVCYPFTRYRLYKILRNHLDNRTYQQITIDHRYKRLQYGNPLVNVLPTVVEQLDEYLKPELYRYSHFYNMMNTNFRLFVFAIIGLIPFVGGFIGLYITGLNTL